MRSITFFLEQFGQSTSMVQGPITSTPVRLTDISFNKPTKIIKKIEPIKPLDPIKLPESKITGDQKGLLTARSVRG